MSPDVKSIQCIPELNEVGELRGDGEVEVSLQLDIYYGRGKGTDIFSIDLVSKSTLASIDNPNIRKYYVLRPDQTVLQAVSSIQRGVEGIRAESAEQLLFMLAEVFDWEFSKIGFGGFFWRLGCDIN
ncbi:MAG: hypothetical protein AAGJ32_10125 [Pseudomonadota bacterium]